MALADDNLQKLDSSKPLSDAQSRTFVQRRFLTTRIHELVNDGVVVKIRSPFSQFEVRIPYEAISDSWFRTTHYSKRAFWFGLVLTSLAIIVGAIDFFGGDAEGVAALIYYGVPGIVLLTIAALSRTVWIGIHSEQGPLLLQANRPSGEEVQEFIDHMQSCKKEYLLKKYVPVQIHDSAVKELERLARLLQEGVITDSEFETLKKQIMEDMPDPDQQRIGF